MKEIVLDGKKLLEREEAQEYLKKKFSFPDHYGKNLDALHDCLCELTDVHIVIKRAELLHEKYSYGKRVLKVIKDSAEENPALTAEAKE